MRTSTHNICLDEARKWGDAEYMTDGLILTNNIAHSLLLDGPVRLNFIVMGLCKKGEATYSVDTCQHKVKAGDLMFISDGHILDAYEPSSKPQLRDEREECVVVAALLDEQSRGTFDVS